MFVWHFHVAVLSDCGLVGNKHKTHLNRKFTWWKLYRLALTMWWLLIQLLKKLVMLSQIRYGLYWRLHNVQYQCHRYECDSELSWWNSAFWYPSKEYFSFYWEVLTLNVCEGMWFQHVGIPPYFSREVLNWLNSHFSDHEGPIVWSSCFSDLNKLNLSYGDASCKMFVLQKYKISRTYLFVSC
jgi:hypothetical protein